MPEHQEPHHTEHNPEHEHELEHEHEHGQGPEEHVPEEHVAEEHVPEEHVPEEIPAPLSGGDQPESETIGVSLFHTT